MTPLPWGCLIETHMDHATILYVLLAGAAFLAGCMNAVAGGGTFVTFPMLMFAGIPSVVANASNSVALFPASFASAWAYRKDFQRFEGLSLKAMAIVSAMGGVFGAALLIYTPEKTFNQLVPWLLLVATVIFAFGPKAAPTLRKYITISTNGLLTIQFFIGIYGGYFGGAMGIVSLAFFTLFGMTNLNAMNAMKSVLVGLINFVAVILFISAGKIAWPQTIVMLIFAVLGGYFGARVARGINPKYLRMGIIAISVTVTIVFFIRN